MLLNYFRLPVEGDFLITFFMRKKTLTKKAQKREDDNPPFLQPSCARGHDTIRLAAQVMRSLNGVKLFINRLQTALPDVRLKRA